MNIKPQTQNLLITALILAVIITVLVLVNTPSSKRDEEQNKTFRLFKVFLAGFLLSAIVLYIMQDNDTNAMMTNIIKGDPDF